MNFEKRIAELERHFHADDQIVLNFEDGTQRTIRLKPGEDVLDLCGRVLSDPSCAEADLIRRSVSSSEPGGSRLIELAAAIIASPDAPDASHLDAVG